MRCKITRVLMKRPEGVGGGTYQLVELGHIQEGKHMKYEAS